MNQNEKFKVPADYLLHREGSDRDQKIMYFLFDVKAGGVFNLNATSYDFLSQCDGTRTVAEILQSLTAVYQVSVNVLESDFEDLIGQWVKMGVLQNVT